MGVLVKSRAVSLICVALAAMSLFQVAHAATLTFEDLDPSPASFDVMPSPYGGFTFSGWFFGPDTLYTPASGVIDLFTDYADPNDPGAYVITSNNAITSASPFIFDGATFSGYSGVTFELYLGGNLVHTSATLADAVGPAAYLPTALASGYGLAVDTVKVSGVQGYYSMDDFSYRAIAAVPEPGTFALLGLGLGVMALRAKRGKITV
jgi:PEP-CTERM motif